jgi:hypothetical protein
MYVIIIKICVLLLEVEKNNEIFERKILIISRL